MRWVLLVAIWTVSALTILADHPANAAERALAQGDFDHDGLIDAARVVRGSDGHFRVVVYSGAKGRRSLVVYDFGRSKLDYFVARDTPGRYETACHKGYGPDARDGQPCAFDYLDLKGDVFSFGVAESSEAVAWWTGHEFKVVWISD